MEIVLKHLGYLLMIFSVFPLLPVLYALLASESIIPFLSPMLISFLIGFWLVKRKGAEGKDVSFTSFDIPRSISLFALSFISVSLLGAIPFFMIQGFSFIDSLFESVSGFTTTGLTVFNAFDGVSRSLLLWRAETQWIGGLGMLLLFLIIVSAMRRQESLKDTTTKARAIANLYQAQGASEKIEANMKKSIRNTVLIYLGYSVLGILLLAIVGLSAFEAVSICLTAISTGGFSVTNEFYTSWSVLGVLLFLMIAGSTSWVLHDRIFKGALRDVLRDRAFRFYLFVLVVASVLVIFSLGDVKVAVFEIVSAFTTTGYSIVDVSALPAFVIFLIMCGMIIGGMIGSTAGGIKINRFLILLKSIPWLVRKIANPSGAIIPMKSGRKVIDDENILLVDAFSAIYFIVLFSGTAVLMLTGLSFLDSSFQTASALGVVGLSTTAVSAFSGLAKSVLIVSMLFGRLEIIPLLVLGRFIYDRVRNRMRSDREAARKLFYINWIPSKMWKKEP